MYNSQAREKFNTDVSSKFTYGGLTVKMMYKSKGIESWNQGLTPSVWIYCKNQLLGNHGTLPDAVKYVFMGVRVCRPDIAAIVGDDRSDVLIALESLAMMSGISLGSLTEIPAIKHRVHISAEAMKHFASWDDAPQVVIHCSLSSIDRQVYNDESVIYRIELFVHGKTVSVTEHCPVWKRPDLQALTDELAVKHFA